MQFALLIYHSPKEFAMRKNDYKHNLGNLRRNAYTVSTVHLDIPGARSTS